MNGRYKLAVITFTTFTNDDPPSSVGPIADMTSTSTHTNLT